MDIEGGEVLAVKDAASIERKTSMLFIELHGEKQPK